MSAAPSLTNLQRELLDLFALRLPESDLIEVKRLLARHFAKKATQGFEDFAEAQELSTDETDTWAFEHRRARASRTAS